MYGDQSGEFLSGYRCLKGLCHAICYLFKKQKLFLQQLKSKTNGPVFLFETICSRCNRLLSSVAMDGKHGHGLKLEKAGPLFSSFNAMPAKIAQKIL